MIDRIVSWFNDPFILRMLRDDRVPGTHTTQGHWQELPVELKRPIGRRVAMTVEEER